MKVTMTLDEAEPVSQGGLGSSVVMRFGGLRKAFGGNVVLRGVGGRLQAGEVILLRGENGSGKTTLLNILTGNLEADDGEIEIRLAGRKERFYFPRPWHANLNPFDGFTADRVARAGVARTWQDMRLFRNLTVAQNLEVGARRPWGEALAGNWLRRGRVHEEESAARRHVSILLKQLGLESRRDWRIDQLPLGEAKCIALARALAAGGCIIFLDEPLAGLDLAEADAAVKMLDETRRSAAVTLVLVEHASNIPRVLPIVDRVWTLREGAMVVESRDQVLAELEAQRRAEILEWLSPLRSMGWTLSLTRLPKGGLLQIWSPPDARSRDSVIEVDKLAVRRGDFEVLGPNNSGGSVSFALRAGEIGILQGPNGWGKTTLMEAIAGILPIANGQLRLFGRSATHLQAYERGRLGVGLQRAVDGDFQNLTALEMASLYEAEGVGEWIPQGMGVRVANLSGGQRRRLVLEALLGSSRELLLLDEPFLGLDGSVTRQLQELLLSRRNGRAILMTTPKILEVSDDKE